MKLGFGLYCNMLNGHGLEIEAVENFDLKSLI